MKKKSLYTLFLVGCIAGSIWIFLNQKFFVAEKIHSVCIFKNVTGIPCPACGSTRSVVSFLQGDLYEAIQGNPVGIFLLLFGAVSLLWIILDLLLKKESYYRLYLKMEALLRKPLVFIPAILLLLGIWIWNIAKGL